MYQFVHVPKTGGLALQSFLIKHYRWDLELKCSVEHDVICTPWRDSIIIIREPVSRFMSMYRFWKNGSDKMRPQNEHKETIKEYIELIKTNNDHLIDKYTKYVHYRGQYTWIPKNTWSQTIVLRYKSDMSQSANELLEYLGITPKCSLEYKNVSKGPQEVLDEDDIKWIRDYYKKDFELWDSVNNHPELFKKVI
jgi:hypothetical protein